MPMLPAFDPLQNAPESPRQRAHSLPSSPHAPSFALCGEPASPVRVVLRVARTMSDSSSDAGCKPGRRVRRKRASEDLRVMFHESGPAERC